MDTTASIDPGYANDAAGRPRQPTAALALLALGVVYGDIGTSPLYAAKETFNPAHGIPLTPENVLGGVSAIFWALMIVVSLKYVTLVLRADNRGEGGIMALLALASSGVGDRPRLKRWLLGIGVFGASLFYGDAVLTPAISVLSAVEGLEVGTAALKPYVVPVAVGVLVALFVIQKHGTGVVGLLFGPVCLAWFAALAAVGVWNVGQAPAILAALDPSHALRFATAHGAASFVVLGSVLLAITGAEALYADMGHFGKRAIRVAWFAVAAPALVLNYFGQGALLLTRPELLHAAVVWHSRLLAQVLPLQASYDALHGKKLWLSHGTHDNVIPLANAQAIAHHMATLPVSVTYREYPSEHEIRPSELAATVAWLESFSTSPTPF